ncbi:MAG: AsmA family protein, partial [Alphaproteobacteria bacterium]|nr:AsmA family protein [Alphaproteobacteria bacterium]
MRFLRETLTVMAGLVLLALMAALAGPWFVDWNRYRAFAEKTLSEALGAPVTIGGQIGLKLLPTPRLNLSDVRLSLSATGSDAAFGQLRTNAGARAPAAMTARVERIQLELGIAPLLRGKWQFVEARIERPDINLRLADDGSLLLPKPATVAAGQIAFENVIIVNARVSIEMAGGAQLALGGIDMRASGASLAGPFRGEGHVRLGDQTPAFFFNTGVAEEEGLRFKFITEAAGALPRFEYEALASLAGGMVAAASTRLQHVLLAGQARIAGQQPRAWNASGALRIGEGSAVFAPFELRTGDAETGISATGEMQYNFARQLAQIQIEAPRIDADQLAGGRVAPADALGNLQGWIAALVEGDVTGVRLPVAFDISLKTPALTLGGETLGDVSARLAPQGGRQAQLHFSGQFPGRTAISLEGVAETGSAAKFSGKIDAHFRDLERFSAWAQRGAHVFNSAATALRDLHVAGGVEISRAGFLGRDLTIATGRSRFRGLVSYLREGGSGRPRLAINVASPELNLDSLPDLTAPLQALGGTDLSFRLDANAVRLARVGGGKLDSGLIGI